MNVIVNGEHRLLDSAATLDSLVENPRGIAIALNGVVIPAADWESAALRNGDVVEIVTARQGG